MHFDRDHSSIVRAIFAYRWHLDRKSRVTSNYTGFGVGPGAGDIIPRSKFNEIASITHKPLEHTRQLTRPTGRLVYARFFVLARRDFSRDDGFSGDEVLTHPRTVTRLVRSGAVHACAPTALGVRWCINTWPVVRWRWRLRKRAVATVVNVKVKLALQSCSRARFWGLEVDASRRFPRVSRLSALY